VIVLPNISEHVFDDVAELVKLARSHLVICLLVQLQILEPERCVLDIVLKALLANIDGLLDLIFSLFESGGIQEHTAVVLAMNHQVLELPPSHFSLSKPALTEISFQKHPPNLLNMAIATSLDGVNECSYILNIIFLFLVLDDLHE